MTPTKPPPLAASVSPFFHVVYSFTKLVIANMENLADSITPNLSLKTLSHGLRVVEPYEIRYLEYFKTWGFATCYIWACPLIKGEDYIFYCHLETQKTPEQDKLRQWYKSMLKKGSEDGVVMDYTNLYNQFFVASGEGNTKITAAHLPFFDSDYWSGAAENIGRKLEVEETSDGGLQSKLPNKRNLKAMEQDKPDVVVKDVLVMQKLIFVLAICWLT
ncbi:unnamed protein product [Lactuca saligna]|uniref:histone acetyltransferase n=1 Tax=Lactuca saligna TaxID=75948 RepID=A0AA35Z2H8_LACSI|nr:unnamed protein product [Lactuca saligna]